MYFPEQTKKKQQHKQSGTVKLRCRLAVILDCLRAIEFRNGRASPIDLEPQCRLSAALRPRVLSSGQLVSVQIPVDNWMQNKGFLQLCWEAVPLLAASCSCPVAFSGLAMHHTYGVPDYQYMVASISSGAPCCGF